MRMARPCVHADASVRDSAVEPSRIARFVRRYIRKDCRSPVPQKDCPGVHAIAHDLHEWVL